MSPKRTARKPRSATRTVGRPVRPASGTGAPTGVPSVPTSLGVAADALDGVPETAPGALQAYLARVSPEVVAMTYWFDPAPEPPRQSVTIRFSGRRLGVSRPQSGDQFVHDETMNDVVAGSGPVAVTVKIRDINPGEWTVDAHPLPRHAGPSTDAPVRGGRRRTREPDLLLRPARWSWRHWRVLEAPAGPVQTCPAPLVRPPAVLVGSWAALVVLGIVVALVIQALVISSEGLQLGHVLTVSSLSLLAGVVGAKAWFVVLHRKERRREGWCVQGMVAGIVVSAPALLAGFHVPIGTFLDATTPGMLIGVAVGRVGCFLTGCCAGRPTSSRWALWSSNRSVGARRIPTQLMESALALAVGLTALWIVLGAGPQRGTLFVAGLAAYTLARQGILLVREERRQSRLGVPIVAVVAASILVIDIVVGVLA